MGDLGEQTAVEPVGEGRFRATLSADWEIWGPMGGYVAAHALRAAGATTPHPRPAAFSCHYLGVARFEPVDIVVEARKEGRAASSHRVAITQEGRPILEALVWSAAEGEGLEHDETTAPAVPGPAELASIHELVDPEDEPPFPFWLNFDAKPISFTREWPPDGPLAAEWVEWLRFLPTASWDDPWIDACRSVILVDLPSWPAANRPHAWKQEPWMAPTLDLNVAFHRPTSGHEWLLCDGTAPVSTGGLFGWTGRVWGQGGELLSSGGGQCLYRRMRT
ncbi:thioesterase family protein [Iamia sp. SCSIO 61187]|uniref:acyl-CoA thioesterase n=1 Tax=Iamia sp. SCSIO 61187 TaxID=2722752 RepID=UPI001C631829|nr:thioesterase family protein [Iamia sp. SCSIO 61187]QYG91913.1 thioesterase family protein [Iamia sp. SCSIO 61187]